MTNTTPFYWAADGVSLQTLAQNIETLGSRFVPPKLRGSNIIVPFRPGGLWLPKVADERILPLSMWVRGANADGTVSADRAQLHDDNWRALRNLLWQPDRQFLLEKRFKIAGTTKTATALAQFDDGLDNSMLGRTASKFTVDLRLADPYFYDNGYTTFGLSNGDQNIYLDGDVKTNAILLTITGSRSNIKVLNKTLGIQVQYTAALATGAVATIDVKNASARTVPVGSPAFKSTGYVRHTGDAQFMLLAPGTNVINVSSDSGTVALQMQAKGAWI